MTTTVVAPDPTASAHTSTGIEEPQYAPAVKAQLDQLRASIIATINANGVRFSSDSNWPIKQRHWRDVYQQHRHTTRICPTPDPRADPSYSPPSLAPTWPDWHLHRFLVARKFHVHDSHAMFINNLAWRRAFGVDDLAAQPQCPFGDVRASLIPERVHHTDAHGRPLYIALYGPINTDRVLSLLSVDVMLVLEAYRLEQFAVLEQALSEQHRRRITQISVILDAQGCTLYHRHLMKWVSANSLVGQPFYPEFLCHLFIVNIPSFFPMLWNVVKRLLDERIQAKVHLLGHDYAGELCAKVGKDCVPREWGGACSRCEGGRCLPVFKAEDPEAERLKLKGLVDQYISSPHSHEEVHLAARHSHTVEVAIRHQSEGAVSSTVWWRVAVAHRDVDLSLAFLSAKGLQEELVSAVKVHNGVPGDGVHQFLVMGAADEGVVRFVISNAHSMFTGKTVTLDYGLHTEPLGTTTA